MSYETLFTIFKIGIICFFLNLPFGMIRSRFTSYSVMWFLSIHAPIPVAAILRRAAGFSFWYIFKEQGVGVAFDAGAEYGGLVEFFYAKKDGPYSVTLDGDVRYFAELKFLFGH